MVAISSIYGEWIFPNGKVYKGNFKNNKPDGNGNILNKGGIKNFTKNLTQIFYP